VSTILCPTRGGQASIPNQDRAIALTKELGADLIFLYVSDVHFLDHLRNPVAVEDVERQLDEIGEFVLVMAKERAEKAGLSAEAVVRRGSLSLAIDEVIRANDVTMVVLGSGSQGTGITTPEYRRDLADYLVSEFGVEVVISAIGEVVEHHKPPQQAS
jgi:nucleotide-binding universal stress UspA family protein